MRCGEMRDSGLGTTRNSQNSGLLDNGWVIASLMTDQVFFVAPRASAVGASTEFKFEGQHLTAHHDGVGVRKFAHGTAAG